MYTVSMSAIYRLQTFSVSDILKHQSVWVSKYRSMQFFDGISYCLNFTTAILTKSDDTLKFLFLADVSFAYAD